MAQFRRLGSLAIIPIGYVEKLVSLKSPSKSILPRRKSDRLILILALLGVFTLGYMLIFYSPMEQAEHGEILGELIPEGTVRRRHARSLAWQDVNRSTTVYIRDYIYVPKGRRAVIVLANKKTIQLEPDTLVQLDEVSFEGLQVSLYGGELGGTAKVKVRKIKLTRPLTKVLASLPSLDPFELRFEELTQRIQTVTSKMLPVEPLPKKLAFHLPLDRISYFDVKLLEPVQGARLAAGKNKWIRAVWSPVPLQNLSYELQVSRNKEFDYFVSYKTKTNKLSLQFRQPGIYHWRLIIRQGTKSTTTKSSHFWVERKGAHEGLLTRIPTSSISDEPYLVEVARSASSGTTLSRTLTTKKKCSAKGLQVGRYICRVRDSSTSTLIESYVFRVKRKK